MASETTPKDLLEPYDDERKRRIHAMFQSWINVDEEGAREQQETFDYLKKALDENRHSQRKLFR